MEQDVINISEALEAISEENLLVQSADLHALQTDRIIEMAWEDRTPFEAILLQFGLREQEVVALMRKSLKASSFRLWRKRVHSKVSTKHLKKRSVEITRFKCTLQRSITHNKISKR